MYKRNKDIGDWFLVVFVQSIVDSWWEWKCGFLYNNGGKHNGYRLCFTCVYCLVKSQFDTKLSGPISTCIVEEGFLVCMGDFVNGGVYKVFTIDWTLINLRLGKLILKKDKK